MTATERDRETAQQIMWRYRNPDSIRDAFADALAAERARVLAPIQALVTELTPLLAAGHDVSGRDLADRLRAAIEEAERS